MAKIYERLQSTNILREKWRDSFDHPQRVILLGEDNIYRVNLLEIPRVIAFFFITSLTCFGYFKRESFVLSRKHENQNVATIGTLLDQFMLSSK